MICQNCSAQVEDTAVYCPNCGAKVLRDTPVQPRQPENYQPYTPPVGQPNYQPYTPPAGQPADPSSHAMNGGMLAWSIINAALLCLIAGIIAIVNTVNAKNAQTGAEEARYLKNAKVANIVGTVIGGLVILFYVIMLAIGMSY